MNTVSIIIPTYNRSALLRRAIESALAQTYREREIIVVDDGSTDDTAVIAASYGSDVTYLHQENSGVAAARNTGAAHAAGDFLLFLDSDDALLPDAAATLVGTLGPFPTAGMAYGQAAIVDMKGTIQYIRKPPFQRPAGPWEGHRELVHLLLQSYLATPAILIRRSVWSATGGFDPSRGNICEDWDLWARIAQIADICYVPVPVVNVTSHANSLSSAVSDTYRSQFLANHWQIIARTMSDPRVQAQPDLYEARVQAAYLFHSARLAYAQHDLKTAHQDMAQAVRTYPKILLDHELEEAASLWLKLRVPSGVITAVRGFKHRNSTG